MKNRNVAQVCILLLLAVVLTPLVAHAEERISSFIVMAHLEEDGALRVEERITVTIEHNQIRHGIYRVYPVLQRLKNGQYKRYGFEVLSITLDGKEVPYSSATRNGYKALAIGSEKHLAPLGKHTYTIAYRTIGHVLFFDNRDEIYLNVTGNDWKLPIDRASFKLFLPGGDGNILETMAFTGALGEKGSDYRMDDRNILHTTRRLVPGEGFTVALAWKKGIVTQPAPTLEDWIHSNRELAYLGVLSILVLYYLFRRWWLANASKHPVIPLFSAPEGMSPGYMAALKSKAYTGQVLHADILWAAVNGYLRMDMADKKNIVMHSKTPAKTPPEWVDNLCKGFVEHLCCSGTAVCDLQTESGQRQARNAFREQVRKYHKGQKKLWSSTIFSKISGWILMGILFIYVTTMTDSPTMHTGVFDDELELTGTIGTLFIIIACGCFGIRNTLRNRKGVARIALVVVAFVLFVVGGLAGLWLFAEGDYTLIAMMGVLAVAASILMARLPSGKYSKEGLAQYTQVQGLEMYILTAEKHRLAMLNAPDDTIEKYEELLPYAVALGCADTWQKRFDSLLSEMEYVPEWVETQGGGHADHRTCRTIVHTVTTSTAMSVAMAACVASSNVSSITSPRSSGGSGFSGSSSSSGSSGGGSSGGGSGGGGGGGW